MKQRYAVVVLFALIMASSLVSLTSYRATEQLVAEDMNQALSKALDEQQSDMISADTIQVFNSHLQIEGLRGNAVLAVDTTPRKDSVHVRKYRQPRFCHSLTSVLR